MRRALIGLLASGLMLGGGCGSSEREFPASHGVTDPKLTTPGTGTPPAPAKPPAQTIPTAVRSQLDAGRVAIVDITGKAGYKPSSLEIAQDASLTGLKWSRWGAGGATGTGTLRFNACNPTCASGSQKALPATIRLSSPSPCPDGRFFAASKVTPSSGPAPASYLRSPC
jgi:hypothetical protein